MPLRVNTAYSFRGAASRVGKRISMQSSDRSEAIPTPDGAVSDSDEEKLR